MASTSMTKLNRNGETERPCFVLNISRKAKDFSWMSLKI